jgi:hypothetical protein
VNLAAPQIGCGFPGALPGAKGTLSERAGRTIPRCDCGAPVGVRAGVKPHIRHVLIPVGGHRSGAPDRGSAVDQPWAHADKRTVGTLRVPGMAPASADVPGRVVQFAWPLGVQGSGCRDHFCRIVVAGKAAPEEYAADVNVMGGLHCPLGGSRSSSDGRLASPAARRLWPGRTPARG